MHHFIPTTGFSAEHGVVGVLGTVTHATISLAWPGTELILVIHLLSEKDIVEVGVLVGEIYCLQVRCLLTL